MQLIGFTHQQILTARDTCGVPNLRLDSGAWRGTTPDIHGISTCYTKAGKVRYYSCVLRLNAEYTTGPRGGRVRVINPFARSSGRTKQSGSPRYTNGVTWDGHYKFMAKLFEQNGEGIIRTHLLGFVEYRGEADFYFKAGGTRNKPHGPAVSVHYTPGTFLPTFERATFGSL